MDYAESVAAHRKCVFGANLGGGMGQYCGTLARLVRPKDLYSLLSQFRTPETKLRGFVVYESCGYVMFENRFCAKKVAVTFFSALRHWR